MATKQELDRVEELREKGIAVAGLATIWFGSVGKNGWPDCDVCKHIEGRHVPNEAVVDGKTVNGPWANMCLMHFAQVGVGLGTGRGQAILRTVEDERKRREREPRDALTVGAVLRSMPKAEDDFTTDEEAEAEFEPRSPVRECHHLDHASVSGRYDDDR